MFVISNPQIIHKHNKKRWKGTWTVGYCCLCVTGLGTIKPSLKADGEVGLAPAEKNWNLMPGHHFQLGNRQAWEGVLFFGTFGNLLAGFVWINLPKGTPTQPNSNFGGFCPTQTLSLGLFLFAYSFLFFFDWSVILISTCEAEDLSPGSVHHWFDSLVKKLIASCVFQYERVSNSAINPGIRRAFYVISVKAW